MLMKKGEHGLLASGVVLFTLPGMMDNLNLEPDWREKYLAN